MIKILVVDDEEKIRLIVKEYGLLSNYDVYEANNGYQAIELVKQHDFSCVVLDIMMPQIDGYNTCKKIRSFSDVPIIMLSARSEEYDKLFGFNLGIDDYVTKPFSPKELMARIKVLIDRNQMNNQKIYQFDNLIINPNARDIIIDNQKVIMTPKTFDLLLYLVKNKNIALSRYQLLTQIWGDDYEGDERTVDSHIKMLRSNLNEYAYKIVTVRSMGYKFED